MRLQLPPPLLSCVCCNTFFVIHISSYASCRYSTCGEKDFVNESVVPIQDFYMKETQKAIYLAVDVSFKTPHVPLKAFFCPTSVLLFKHVP